MGKLINVRHDILRSYYNETDKANSDYDHVYPIVLFSDVKENLTSTAKSLNQVLQNLDNNLSKKISEKQNTIIGGNENNIVAYSQTPGYLNELVRLTKINNSKIAASEFKIPTEKAVVDLIHDDVYEKIKTLQQNVTIKIDELEGMISASGGDFSQIFDRLDTINNDVKRVSNELEKTNNKVSDLDSKVQFIEELVSGLDEGVFDPTNPESIPALNNRVTDLEKKSVTKESFGIDGKYVKDITVASASGSVLLTESRASVENTVIENKLLSIQSSDNSVSFTVDNPTENTTRIDIKAIGGGGGSGEGGNYVVANAPITPNTKAKITYDSKGLVTGGDDLTADDIPTGISIGKIEGLGSKLSNLETQVGLIDNKLTPLETTVEELRSNFEILDNTVKQHTNDILNINNTLDGKVDSTDFDELKTKIDEVIESGVDYMTLDEFTSMWDNIFVPAPAV